MEDKRDKEPIFVDDVVPEEMPLDKVGMPTRALSRLLTVTLASLLVMTIAIMLTSGLVRIPQIAFGPTPASTALPLPSGWQHAGPGFGDEITFSPQAPTTLYVCAGIHHRIALGVSLDSGSHWHTAILSIAGDACHLAINPYDRNELAIEVSSGCIALCDLHLYRSFDAGQHWQAALLPDQFTGFANLVWTSSDLFAQPDYGNVAATGPQATYVTQARHQLAVSRHHGAFAWVTLPIANDTSNPNPPFLSESGASDTTIFIGYQAFGGSQVTMHYYQSHDAGVTWQVAALPVTFQLDAPYPVYLTFAPLVHALIIIGTDIALISYDGGANWQAPEPLPATLPGYESPGRMLLLAPDGTRFAVYVYHDRDEAHILYRATSAQSRWQQSYRGHAVDVMTMTWDAQEHPTALWGTDSIGHLVMLPL